ncbi:hypothetical protein SLA2020_033990 [Shorea laevis]
MAKRSAARMVFFVVLMALTISTLAQPLLQKKVESCLLLQELGYDEKKLEHYRHVFTSIDDGDKLSPSGPDPKRNSGPQKCLKHIYCSLLS